MYKNAQQSVGCVAEVARIPDVQIQLNNLEKAVAALDDRLSVLTARLASVIRNPEPQTKNPALDKPFGGANCPLSESIARHTNQLEQQSLRVAHIIDHLEV